jgi:dTDP-4-dehydrorhamnose 3,5-epimerase
MRFVQHSTSYSRRRGTLRGMHFQRSPHAEVKVVHCLRGAIFDVIIDLRSDSPSCGRWQSFELTADDHRHQLYVPAGCAHGFQTLADHSEVGYFISAFYEPAAARVVRYDDPRFAIAWPLPVTVISARDSAWPDAAPA